MAETTTTAATPKSKKPVGASVPPAFETPKFEMPKFDIPKFDLPNMEIPAAFRDMAEKGIAHARENYEKVKSAAEQATDVLEDTYATTSKGCADFGLKLIETARTNTNATFDFYGELLAAKSFAEVVEKSAAYVRAQFDAFATQAKDIAEHAHKVANESTAPIRENLSSLGKVG